MARACQRRLFGSRLGELGMVQQMIADNEIDIAASRGLILQACWELDQLAHLEFYLGLGGLCADGGVGRTLE